MTLYEINEAVMNCVKVSDTEAVDTTTGEVISIDELEHLEMEKEEKIENCIKFYKNLLAEHEAYKKEADRLSKLAKTQKNKAEQLKAYMGYCLNGEKFKSEDGLHQVSFRRSEAIEVLNLWDIPDHYMKYKDPEPDKTAIKEAIKSGLDVKGAALIEKQNVVIK